MRKRHRRRALQCSTAGLLAVGIASSIAAWTPDARAEGASIEQATDEQKEAAKQAYIAGMEAFQAERFDEALKAFRESYDTVRSPNSHLLVARTLARLGRNVEAYEHYTATIEEAEEAAKTQEKYEKTALAARNERKEVETRVGFVQATVDATIRVGDNELGPASWGEPIPVAPGPVEVTLTTPSGEQTTVSVEVAAGKAETVALAPPAPKPAEPKREAAPAAPRPSGIPHRTLAWVSGGIGVAGFASFAAFGVLNDKQFDDLEGQCPNGICPPDLTDEADRGRRYQAIANASLGVGIAGIGAAAILFLTAPSKNPEGDRQARGPHLRDVAIGPRSVTVRGQF